MTAVEWLVNEYFGGVNNCTSDVRYYIEQAKAMEKEQIIRAAADHCYPTCELAMIDAEEYYKATFKSE